MWNVFGLGWVGLGWGLTISCAITIKYCSCEKVPYILPPTMIWLILLPATRHRRWVRGDCVCGLKESQQCCMLDHTEFTLGQSFKQSQGPGCRWVNMEKEQSKTPTCLNKWTSETHHPMLFNPNFKAKTQRQNHQHWLKYEAATLRQTIGSNSWTNLQSAFYFLRPLIEDHSNLH